MNTVKLYRLMTAKEKEDFLKEALQPGEYIYISSDVTSKEEVVDNAESGKEYLLTLEVTEKDYARCKSYFGRDYKVRYPDGTVGLRDWEQFSAVVPFVPSTCVSYSIETLKSIKESVYFF